MKMIRVNKYRVSDKVLTEAVDVLKDGGVVVFPTETAYGLAADHKNKLARQKVYKIKGRVKNKNLSLIAADLKMVMAAVKLPQKLKSVAKKFWPGPLSIAVSKEIEAIRISKSVWARALARGLGRPITATSANLSGQKSEYTARNIFRTFKLRKFKPDLILDAGTLPKRPASTIIGLRNRKVVILRQGQIKIL